MGLPAQKQTCSVTNTHAGQFPDHPWKLCHMHGNVWEWCGNDSETSKDFRMKRGGGYHDAPRDCRSATRSSMSPDFRSAEVGFRVCYRPDK